MLQRTPLFPLYAEYGAKTIDFGGWELPVQFSSIKEEHEAVRTRAGLFDVSHMGEFEVKGKDSLAFLQKMMTNDVAKLTDGRAQYTLMCYEDGGTVDDLLVYKKADDHYLLVVNAANIEKDFAWLSEHVVGDVELVNISNDIAQLALQGPLAEKVLQQLTTVDLSTMKFFAFADHVDVAGVQTLVSRTGYTGEDGFELYCRAEDAPTLWRTILEAGKEEGVLPCGLGARDTLRFEACLPLYGQELAKDITPIDVREPDEYAAGHILGARNIPLSQLRLRMKELRKDQPIYLYCQSGIRSSRAAQMLYRNGYRDLYHLKGGFKMWTGKVKKK